MHRLYAIPLLIFFCLVNLTVKAEVVEVNIISLTEDYELMMPEGLMPYKLLAYAAADEADGNEISQLIFEIDGEIIEASLKDSTYFAWWTPAEYGSYTITTSAKGANGGQKFTTANIEVVDASQDMTVSTFDEELISYPNGIRAVTKNFTFPTGVNAYKSITGNLSIGCPDSGCDPYDRVAWVEVQQKGGEWIEIIRYITPFGVACDHSIDLTDFAQLLQGELQVRVFIDTWAGGWTVNLDLDYEAGVPTHPYIEIDRLWDGAHDFGNLANLQPLDTFFVNISDKAAKAKLKMCVTGHGWGENNTLNAAEFLDVTHALYVGNTKFDQKLWYSCTPNPDGCSPQNGTWNFNRAGWCPGAIGKMHEYDLSSFISGGSYPFKYIFKSYVDLCHPNHPNCVTNITCQDCDAGFNPHYWFAANLVTYYDEVPGNTWVISPVIQTNYSKVLLTVFPNPSTGFFDLHIEDDLTVKSIKVVDVNGKIVLENDFPSKSNKYQINMIKSNAGVYTLIVETTDGLAYKKLLIL